MMTLAELTASLSQSHVKNYPVALARRQKAIETITSENDA
jgi:hypothetical protein